MPLDAIIFDTETTDLIHNSAVPLKFQPHVIELYAKRIRLPDSLLGSSMDDWELVDEYQSLVNPGVKISDEVIGITGITNEMVKNAPKIEEIWDAVRDFFSASDINVAHNISYDKQIMTFEQMRVDKTKQFPWARRLICTVESTEHIKGRRLNLTDLHMHLFGCAFEDAHRAKSDVDADELCFKKLWEQGVL